MKKKLVSLLIILLLFTPIFSIQIQPIYSTNIFISASVVTGSDDGYELLSSAGIDDKVDITYSTVPVGGSAYYNYTGAFRFINLSIPQGSSIIDAKLTLYKGGGDGVLYARIYADYADDSPTLGTNSRNITGRTWTTAYYTHTFNANAINWGQSFGAVEIKEVVQELVGKSGWKSNALTIIVTRDTSNVDDVNFMSYEGNGGVGVAKIEITYFSAGEPPPPPNVDPSCEESIFSDVLLDNFEGDNSNTTIVNVGSDDGYELLSSAGIDDKVDITLGSVPVGGSAYYNYTGAFRFTGLSIPRGSFIISAKLTLYEGGGDGVVYSRIYFEFTNDTKTLGTNAKNITSRQWTSSYVTNTFNATATGWSEAFPTITVTKVVQEVVNIWNWNNATLTAIVARNTNNTEGSPINIMSYEGNGGANTAELEIIWTSIGWSIYNDMAISPTTTAAEGTYALNGSRTTLYYSRHSGIQVIWAQPQDWSGFNALSFYVKLPATETHLFMTLGSVELPTEMGAPISARFELKINLSDSFLKIRIRFDRLDIQPSFDWTRIRSLQFEFMSPESGDILLDDIRLQFVVFAPSLPMIEDFENGYADWRYVQPVGGATLSTSTTSVQGLYSLRVDYNTTTEGGFAILAYWTSLYHGEVTTPLRDLTNYVSNPINVSIYGDNSGNIFYVFLEDDDGDVFRQDVTINWNGWATKSFSISNFKRVEWAYTGDERLDMKSLVSLKFSIGGSGTGTIYMDDINIGVWADAYTKSAWQVSSDDNAVFAWILDDDNDTVSKQKVRQIMDDLNRHSLVISHISPTGARLSPDCDGSFIETNTSLRKAIELFSRENPNIALIPLINNYDPNTPLYTRDGEHFVGYGDFNSTLIDAILDNAAKRSTLITNLYNYVVDNKYHGICIDVECVGTRGAEWDESYRGKMSTFMDELYNQFQPNGYAVVIAAPARSSEQDIHSWNAWCDYDSIRTNVDFFVPMTYDFHWSTSGAGPIAPFTWVERCLTYAVARVGSSKILLGLGTYAHDWDLTAYPPDPTKPEWSQSGLAESLTWQEAMERAQKFNVPIKEIEDWLYTYKSYTHYFEYTNTTDGHKHEVHLLDSYSLSHKLETLKIFGGDILEVKGVAFWRLGAEQGSGNPSKYKYGDETWWKLVANFRKPTSHLAKIINMDVVNYLFAETKYYHFKARYFLASETVKLSFSDGIHQINMSFNLQADSWDLDSGSNIVTQIIGWNMTRHYGYEVVVIFNIRLTGKIFDASNVELYIYCSNLGFASGWEIAQQDYFNIYNLGGHSTLESSGDAGRITGGDVFDLYARNVSDTGAWVESTMVFRNLQHIKMLPMITWLMENPKWNVSYSFDYYVDDVWVEGFKLKLDCYSTVSNGTRYVYFEVYGYNHGELVTVMPVSAYHTQPGAVGPTNTTTQLWIDLWFNKMNSSSVIAGRVNAYYFPMTDTANPWLIWLTGSNWGIYETRKKQAMIFATMQDDDGNIINTRNIEMVKIKCRLEVGAAWDISDSLVILSDYDIFDLTLGGTPLRGIATPVFDETKVPIMPQGGFIGSIVSWFQGAIKWLSDNLLFGGLNLWGHFVAFMDTIASWLGFPNAFTNFIMWLGSIWGWMTISFGWLISLLTDTFNFLAAFMGKLINTTSTAVGIFTSMIQNFFMFLDSGYGYTVGTWEMLGMTTWVTLFFILYPLYLLTIWEERGLDAMISHIKGVIDIFAFIGTLFIRVIQLTLNVLGRIIESIPVVE